MICLANHRLLGDISNKHLTVHLKESSQRYRPSGTNRNTRAFIRTGTDICKETGTIGKYLHTIICNTCARYSPWYPVLFLIDFDTGRFLLRA